jgi:hypothetical protein
MEILLAFGFVAVLFCLGFIVVRGLLRDVLKWSARQVNDEIGKRNYPPPPGREQTQRRG